MPITESIKQKIDASENGTIEIQEMEEFLKSEENIKKLGEVMDSSTSTELVQEMKNALKDLCEKFLNSNELTDNQEKILNYFLDKYGENYPEIKERKELNKIVDECINTNNISSENLEKIDKRNKLFGSENIEKKNQIKKIIESKVNEISKSVNKIIGSNTIKENKRYKNSQIQMIQLWANVNFGENLELTGERGKNFGKNGFGENGNSDNERITNLYIYRQELITRQQVIDTRKSYKNLFKIPNLNNLLGTLDSKEDQNQVLQDFLKIFLEIKPSPYFENKIREQFEKGFETFLSFLINAQKYKDTPLKTDNIEEYNVPENIKTMGQYYTWKAENLGNQIIKNYKHLTEENEKQKRNKEDLELGEKITGVLDEIKKLRESEKNEKDKNKKVELLNNRIDLFNDVLEMSNSIHDNEYKKLCRKEIFKKMNKTINTDKERKDLEGKESVIEVIFGHTIWEEYKSVMQSIEEKYIKAEEITDISSQLNYIQPDALGIRDIDTYLRMEGEWGFTETHRMNQLNNHSSSSFTKNRPNNHSLYSLSPLTKNQPNVEYVHKMMYIPGIANQIHVSFDKKDQEVIEETMKKANRGEIKLVLPGFQIGKNKLPEQIFGHNASTLITPKDFATVKELNNGNLELYRIGEKEPFKTITKEEQINAETAEAEALNTTIGSADFKERMEDLKDMSGRMDKIQKLASKMNAKERKDRLTNKDEKEIFHDAYSLADELKKLRECENATHSIFDLTKNLKQLRDGRNNKSLTTNQEKQVDNCIKQLELLSGWLKPGSQIDDFIDYMTNTKNIYSNDSKWKEVKHWLKTNLVAIGVALAVCAAVTALAVASCGSGAAPAAVAGAKFIGGITGGMIGYRAGKFVNAHVKDFIENFNTIEVDGHRIHYSDPTDIERLLNGDISLSDFANGIGWEFCIQCVTAGSLKFLGNSVSKMTNYIVNKPSVSAFIDKIPLHKLKDINNTYTRDMCADIGKKGLKNFSKKWALRFGNKMVDAGENKIKNALGNEIKDAVENVNISAHKNIEQFAKKTGIDENLAMLGATLSTYGIIIPFKKPNLYEDNKVALSDFYPKGDSIITDFTYDANIPNAKTNLIEFFKENGFEENSDGTLSRKNDVNEEYTNVIHLQESHVPYDLRSMSGKLSDYGIYFNHESEESTAYYKDKGEMNKFISEVETTGTGTITENSDKTYTYNTSEASITIKPVTDNISGDLQKPDIT